LGENVDRCGRDIFSGTIRAFGSWDSELETLLTGVHSRAEIRAVLTVNLTNVNLHSGETELK